MFREEMLGRRSDLGFLEREGVRVEGGRSSWGGQRGPQATHLWNSVAMVRKLVFYYLHKRGFPGRDGVSVGLLELATWHGRAENHR